MEINIKLDDELLNEAVAVSGISSKKTVVNLALKEYIKINNRKKILNFKGKNIWEGNLDEMRATR